LSCSLVAGSTKPTPAQGLTMVGEGGWDEPADAVGIAFSRPRRRTLKSPNIGDDPLIGTPIERSRKAGW
jgi:hypothetical protein